MNDIIVGDSDIEFLNKDDKNKAQKQDVLDEEIRAYISPDDNAAGGQNGSAWLITFTDIMALMLTFFVLLFSMSVPDEGLFDETPTRTLDANRFLGHRNFSGEQDRTSVANRPVQAGLNLNYLSSLIKQAAAEYPSIRGLEVLNNSDRLVLVLPRDVQFEEGRAELSEEGKIVLKDIAGVLRNVDNQIIVVGHADSQGANTPDTYWVNWKISVERAMHVAQTLSSYGLERKMIARGVSQARFAELPRDLSDKQRMDFARRIDLIIRPEKAAR
ncbi:MAG: hypothetical protein CL561_05835 [Alphaproteobacteria bacterium]|nr:hypothetical protein [Alphaproteobacteria bacterium]|tara:strand:- start:2503 stop:3318 length:816 start_codon:yes stop_codon:yes gene_type:complete